MAQGPCTHGVLRAPSSVVYANPPTARTLSSEAQHTGPGPQAAASPEGSAFLHSVKGPGLCPFSTAGGEGVATSSKSPGPELHRSLHIAEKKRKLQAPGLEKYLPMPRGATCQKAINKPQRAGTEAKGPIIGQGMAHAQSVIVRGALVWYRCGDFPYWPAVVCSVTVREQTARVLLIEANLCLQRSGIRVPLHRLKPLDCEEKSKLQRRASRAFGPSVTWCLSLVAHYREALALRSFKGSFLEYYASDASYPLRRVLREGEPSRGLRFPEVNYSDMEDSEEEDPPTPTACLSSSGSQGVKRPHRRLLPDRRRAAWDRTNQKLVDFIVKTKGADGHLLDIMQGRKPSRLLAAFLREDRYLICMETYLEDDDQLEVVAQHLRRVWERTENPMRALLRVDKVRLVLEVLLPEAVICSIAALEGLDYQDAEEKYLQGPPVRPREKDLFDRKIFKERKKRSAGSREQPRACHLPTA
ncbi:PWWP domain-containing protein MUM1-like [Octodon degus]|uniref:PWWP domain-containing protein MUM1-like n=1 Tax=Octodon degus TaxID=10160 RepID=A0A6P3VEP6_OCTDE|nr:PWWP domain-containing protein MUM1-like [Octodon degus]